jgi:hypothetical protein
MTAARGLSAVSRGASLTGDLGRALALWRKYRDRTMIRRGAYVANLALVARALRDPRLSRGCVVECGTWRGGMAAGLIGIGGHRRRYAFFDSFEGLPEAQAVDGADAFAWQADTTSPRYFDNCSASYDEFMRLIAATGCPATQVRVVRGFFEETFATISPEPVAVLRLDADWYDSTMAALETFWPHLLPGALVLIDDYYQWVGCRRAVHDFLSRRSATEAIRRTRIGGVAYLVREESS